MLRRRVGLVQKGQFALENGQLPTVPDNVHLHKGWFNETLPAFVKNMSRPISLLHVDCDLYSSTNTLFQHLAPFLVPGSFILFDELVEYPEYLDHEMLSLYEFLLTTDMDIELIGKRGPVRLCPNDDQGAHLQAALVRLVKRDTGSTSSSV
jgi:hypothetical protein